MSGRSVRACVVHRDDGTFALCKEMAATEDRALFAFDVVGGGHRDVRMP
jgi:hypothetical protein